jgi:hypothetical protein
MFRYRYEQCESSLPPPKCYYYYFVLSVLTVRDVFQVSRLVQIFLQTTAAGVLPAELPVVLVDGIRNAKRHGNGDEWRHGNVGTNRAKSTPRAANPFTGPSH